MPTFADTLDRMAVDLLRNGTGLPAPLSSVLQKTYSHQLLRLTLESTQGTFYSTGSENSDTSSNERNLKALPALTDERRNEKRFFFSMSDRLWEVRSAFTIETQSFFTTLTLDISDAESLPLRAGLFKLSDYFTVQCRRHLTAFKDALIFHPSSRRDNSDIASYEKSVLDKVALFSDEVQCAVLLDEDGFIIHSIGNAGSVNELSGALARLFYRSNHQIARLECTECTAISLADHEYSLKIGRLSGTSLAFAISVGGPFAAAQAHFLHTTAIDALLSAARTRGLLWGVSLADIPEQSRTRSSWFGPPKLIPHGKFVGKKGGKSFHTSTCQILSKTDALQLQWFENRAAAITEGLRPCGACNP